MLTRIRDAFYRSGGGGDDGVMEGAASPARRSSSRKSRQPTRYEAKPAGKAASLSPSASAARAGRPKRKPLAPLEANSAEETMGRSGTVINAGCRSLKSRATFTNVVKPLGGPAVSSARAMKKARLARFDNNNVSRAPRSSSLAAGAAAPSGGEAGAEE